MSRTTTRRVLWQRAVALVALGSLVIAGCSSSVGAGSSASAGPSGSVPAAASAGSTVDQAVAALVPTSIKNNGQLRVAVPDGSAPLASVSGSGVIEGMDPDMAQALADLMGLKLSLTAGTFDSQIPGLQSGKFDLAMGEYYVTPKRLAAVDFVTEWTDFSSFATLVSNSWAPQTALDLCGHKIGVMKGSAEEASVQSLNAKCSAQMDISAFPDQASSFLALNSNRIEAVVTGRGPLEGAKAANPQIKISGKFGGGPTATAVARTADSAQMLKAVQAGYTALIQSGMYAKILAKWNTSYGAVTTPVIFIQSSTDLPNYAAY